MQPLSEEFERRMALLVRVLQADRTLPARLEAVTEIAKKIVHTCDAASVSLIVEGQPTTAATTDRVAIEVDLVQYSNEEGPCLNSIDAAGAIRIDVIATDERYPHFAAGAVEFGVESVLSLPLVASGIVVASLNLYSRSPNAFDPATEIVLEPLLVYAAETIGGSPLYARAQEAVEEATAAMEERAIVARAIGVLIERHGCKPSEAYDILEKRAELGRESTRAAADRVLAEVEAGWEQKAE